MSIEVGQIYKHYKGNEYEILAVGKHTETLEDMVVYQDVNHPEKIWVRPKAMFEEVVTKDGSTFTRFELLNI